LTVRIGSVLKLVSGPDPGRLQAMIYEKLIGFANLEQPQHKLTGFFDSNRTRMVLVQTRAVWCILVDADKDDISVVV